MFLIFISNLSQGIYLLKINSDEKNQVVKLVVGK